MKKILFIALMLLAGNHLPAQTTYYRGEWSKAGSGERFTGLFAIRIKANGSVTGELLWKYLACDSTDKFQLTHYINKKGKTAIEIIDGTYDAERFEFAWRGTDKIDPYEIIDTDRYTIKISLDRKNIFGSSASHGTNNGYFYGVKTDAIPAKNELDKARTLLKRKSK
ncbi:MAG: hypothetical protein U0X40_07145 [Ferruginibacter sp.]